MVLLRKVIGDALRARRLAQHRTLREVSTAANVSLGYLSEIERGHKEASSELLASICVALGAPLSEMLGAASATFALAEQRDGSFAAAVAARTEVGRTAEHQLQTSPVRAMDDTPVTIDAPISMDTHIALRPHAAAAVTYSADPGPYSAESSRYPAEPGAFAAEAGPFNADAAALDGGVTVQVHSDGPLKTVLTTKRRPPGQRYTESVFAA